MPTRSTLTSVTAVGERQLWATAHGGLVLGSADAGETWTVAAGRADGPDVLLAVHIGADGHGLAVGGFGTALATRDAGRSWQPQTLVDGEAGERHLNRIVPTPAGTWLVAAEGGLVLRGTGQGADRRFNAVKTPYAGSLWCGVALPGGTVVLGGMRGNLVTSSDDGLTWRHLPVADAGSLAGAALLPDGRPLLVGVDGTMLLGDAAGSRFQLTRLPERSTLTGVVALPGGPLVAATAAGPQALALPG